MSDRFRSAQSRRGFTLIELMIVVVILGILAAIAIPKFNQVSKRSKEAEAAPILKQLYTLQERHHAANGEYATSIPQLEGGASNMVSGKYYSFRLSSGGSSAYVACGEPLDPSLGLSSFRVDETGDVSPGTC
ncbi:MAG TPA: prepilin-type N-terminal cleavage/methylation domain-containing protein [Longimicrobium sp.]|nr:prepilin-type N-terminal cleavage/methylation domain-containing protein [Longimicrobium sp.]